MYANRFALQHHAVGQVMMPFYRWQVRDTNCTSHKLSINDRMEVKLNASGGDHVREYNAYTPVTMRYFSPSDALHCPRHRPPADDRKFVGRMAAYQNGNSGRLLPASLRHDEDRD